jgi:tetratricopeptide (TPR) repeat protein
MRPPLLADDQVECGPDFSEVKRADGSLASLPTPLGEYDLSSAATRLIAEKQPDMVVCLVDASCRNLPRNLAGFSCPKVLLIADTHHMATPLQKMLRYAASEPFDRRILLYDRHHIEFFRGMGIRDLYWFPGLTFPHGDAAVAAARSAIRQPTLAFVGQTGKFHPRRVRVLSAVREAGLPLDQRPLPQDQALAHYGSCAAGINVSLNGDLNLRVFEIIATGSLLLTDRLSADSGLAELFRERQELVSYRNLDELVEQARHYLTHPDQARFIGDGAARWFDSHFSEAKRRDAFATMVFSGVQPEAFPLPPPHTGPFLPTENVAAQRAVRVYEDIQELHKSQDSVCIYLGEESQQFSSMFATLPRVTQLCQPGSCDLAVTRRSALAPGDSSLLWCHDASPADLELLTSSGQYTVVSASLGLLRPLVRGQGASMTCGPARDIEAIVADGLAAWRAGAIDRALAAGRRALQLAPTHGGANRLVGDVLLGQGEGRQALPFLLAALPDSPRDSSLWLALGRALLAASQLGDAVAALRQTVGIDAHNVEAWLLLATLAEKLGKAELASKISAKLSTL